jgi:hypothetical protein
MAAMKSWGSTVVGWFVVQDPADDASQADAADAGAVDEVARRGASTDNADPGPTVFTTPPPAAPGGNVDFDKVFEAAGIDSEERERVGRTLDLINSLPPDTDDAVRKQIVMASLRAFSVPIDKIIEAGAAELQALEGYIRAGAADVSKVVEEAEKRIKQYEEEIVQLKSVMQERVEEQQGVIRNCNTRKLDVQKVLEFFGQEAVAKVVHESPRLHEPKRS